MGTTVRKQAITSKQTIQKNGYHHKKRIVLENRPWPSPLATNASCAPKSESCLQGQGTKWCWNTWCDVNLLSHLSHKKILKRSLNLSEKDLQHTILQIKKLGKYNRSVSKKSRPLVNKPIGLWVKWAHRRSNSKHQTLSKVVSTKSSVRNSTWKSRISLKSSSILVFSKRNYLRLGAKLTLFSRNSQHFVVRPKKRYLRLKIVPWEMQTKQQRRTIARQETSSDKFMREREMSPATVVQGQCQCP